MAQPNPPKTHATPKVELTSDVTTLPLNGIATLKFSFSSIALDFTLDDIKVANGTVTKLVQDALNPLIYTAQFTAGGNAPSNLSTIQLAGAYTDLSGNFGTNSNTIAIKNLPSSFTPTVGFISNNASIIEGSSGTKAMEFTVQLSGASAQAVTVSYTTQDMTYGSAKAGSDFEAVTSSVTFAAGETTKTISVNIIGDTTYEANENFYVSLIGAKGATVVTNGAEGLRNSWVSATIKNDDASNIPTVGFTSNNASMLEGNSGTKAMEFTVQLSGASTEAVTVNYTTQAMPYGSAKAGSDFEAVTSSVTFAAGETTKKISVNVIGDTTYEANENFYVSLTTAKGATVVTNGAEGLRNSWVSATINNDDTVASTTPEGIIGTAGKDTLGGTAHADLIDGKGGADLLTGYSGNDIFFLAKSYATKDPVLSAHVADFKHGFDLIELSGDLNFSALHIAQGRDANVSDTVVSLSSGDILVVLVGVNSATIGASDFIHIA